MVEIIDLFTEIEKAQEQFCQMGLKFDSKTTFLAEAGNGEYLMRRGTFTVPNNPKNFDFEHVYKKVDGQYLMLYDIFSYE
jgi:hypothetical protein